MMLWATGKFFCHQMTTKELRDLDVRRGKASMERYRGEITAQDVGEAETRVRELDGQLTRAMENQ